MLADNLAKVKENIRLACIKGQRTDQGVSLIAVTKAVGVMETKEIIELGIENLAENRVDQLLEKKEKLNQFSSIQWHFIGNLQRRKVKSVINEIDYFHALESLKLAEEIQKRAVKTIACFIEVNISGEESKHGFTADQVIPFIQQLVPLDRIKIIGLMTMAPFNANEQELHAVFSKLKELQVQIQQLQLLHAPCHELSMGMSNDYSIAIQEGATFVRVGTAIFKGA